MSCAGNNGKTMSLKTKGLHHRNFKLVKFSIKSLGERNVITFYMYGALKPSVRHLRNGFSNSLVKSELFPRLNTLTR